MCILFVGLDDRINKSKYENILGLKKVNVVIRNALVVSVSHGAMVCMCTMLPDVANFRFSSYFREVGDKTTLS